MIQGPEECACAGWSILRVLWQLSDLFCIIRTSEFRLILTQIYLAFIRYFEGLEYLNCLQLNVYEVCNVAHHTDTNVSRCHSSSTFQKHRSAHMSLPARLEGPGIMTGGRGISEESIWIDANAVGWQGMRSLDVGDQFFHKIMFVDLTSYGP